MNNRKVDQILLCHHCGFTVYVAQFSAFFERIGARIRPVRWDIAFKNERSRTASRLEGKFCSFVFAADLQFHIACRKYGLIRRSFDNEFSIDHLRRSEGQFRCLVFDRFFVGIQIIFIEFHIGHNDWIVIQLIEVRKALGSIFCRSDFGQAGVSVTRGLH